MLCLYHFSSPAALNSFAVIDLSKNRDKPVEEFMDILFQQMHHVHGIRLPYDIDCRAALQRVTVRRDRTDLTAESVSCRNNFGRHQMVVRCFSLSHNDIFQIFNMFQDAVNKAKRYFVDEIIEKHKIFRTDVLFKDGTIKNSAIMRGNKGFYAVHPTSTVPTHVISNKKYPERTSYARINFSINGVGIDPFDPKLPNHHTANVCYRLLEKSKHTDFVIFASLLRNSPYAARFFLFSHSRERWFFREPEPGSCD